MSEIVLSSTEYDYTNGSMIVDIDPGLKNDSSNNNNSTANSNTVPTTSFEEAYSSYPGKQFFQAVYIIMTLHNSLHDISYRISNQLPNDKIRLFSR